MRIERGKIAILCATLVLLLTVAFDAAGQTASSQGQSNQTATKPQDPVEVIINQAQQVYLEGVDAYNQKSFSLAKRKFDEALDVIFYAPQDINSDLRLKNYYRSLVDKISSLQIESVISKADSFGVQIYTPTAGDELAEVTDQELNSLGESGKLSNKDFTFKATLAPPVYQFITYFTQGKGRQTMLIGLQRAGRYRALAERIFKEERVPTDLIWLAQVESLWSNNALSYAAARGMWQFVPSTGARFGLLQTAWVDERSDPEKSTRAAARYLRYLADYFNGDWLLAMAAYNCGEGRVASAIRQSNITDYWTLRAAGYLPQETRNYVPAILAAIAIAKNPKQYNFVVVPELPQQFQTQVVKSQTSLSALAQKLNLPLSSLTALNPELQRGATPPGAYMVRLPKIETQAEFTTVDVVKMGNKRPTITPDQTPPPDHK